MSAERNNYYFFNVDDDKVYDPIKVPIEIIWQWGEGPLTSKLITASKFETITYTFFNRPQETYSSLRLDRKASEFINSYKKGGKEAAEKMVSTQTEEFPWQRIGWVKEYEIREILLSLVCNYYGEYMGFQNVFTTNVTVEEDDGSKEHIEQTIYLVDEGGQWKVVDISSRESI